MAKKQIVVTEICGELLRFFYKVGDVQIHKVGKVGSLPRVSIGKLLAMYGFDNSDFRVVRAKKGAKR